MHTYTQVKEESWIECVFCDSRYVCSDRGRQTHTTLLHASFFPLVPSSTEMPSWSIKKKVFLCHLWKIWVGLAGYSCCKSSATHSYFCVYGCKCLGFLMCAESLMHALACRGCMDTVTESALKVDPGRKNPCHTRDLSPHQHCAWLFSWTRAALGSVLF